MQDREVVPDVEIARLQTDFELMAVAAHDFLQLLMRGASLVEVVEGRDYGPCALIVPFLMGTIRARLSHGLSCRGFSIPETVS